MQSLILHNNRVSFYRIFIHSESNPKLHLSIPAIIHSFNDRKIAHLMALHRSAAKHFASPSLIHSQCISKRDIIFTIIVSLSI